MNNLCVECKWFGRAGKICTSRDKTVAMRGPCENPDYKGNVVMGDGRVITELVFPLGCACDQFAPGAPSWRWPWEPRKS